MTEVMSSAGNHSCFDCAERLFASLAAGGKNYDIPKIRAAYEYAAKLHDGQMRKSGDPYISHPIAVAEIVASLGLDTDSICAAFLHDTVEDTDVTLEQLSAQFPSEVVEAVQLLTHTQGTTYFDYVRKIRTNPIATKVKLADLQHNSDETRFAGMDVSPEKNSYLRSKYAKARAILLEE